MLSDQSALDVDKAVVDDLDEDDDMDTLGLGVSETSHRLRQQSSAFPLFPFTEMKRNFDIWGEILTSEEVRTITGATAQAASSSLNGGGARASLGAGSGGHNYAREAKLAQEKIKKEQNQKQMKEAQQEEEPQKTIKEYVTVREHRHIFFISLYFCSGPPN